MMMLMIGRNSLFYVNQFALDYMQCGIMLKCVHVTVFLLLLLRGDKFHKLIFHKNACMQICKAHVEHMRLLSLVISVVDIALPAALI